MSMRHSLELRVPFIDRPLIEWLWHQPTAFKSDPRQPKSVLAAAAQDVLPPALATRRKRGFTLPFPTWMRGELRPFLEETFANTSVARSGLFDPVAVGGLWQGYLARTDTREWSRVWSLAVLVAFTNRRTAPVVPTTRPIVDLTPQRPAPPIPPIDRSTGKTIAPKPRRLGQTTLLMAPELFETMGGIPRILQLYLKALCEMATARDGAVRLVEAYAALVRGEASAHEVLASVAEHARDSNGRLHGVSEGSLKVQRERDWGSMKRTAAH
jgi:hypothetical protein